VLYNISGFGLAQQEATGGTDIKANLILNNPQK